MEKFWGYLKYRKDKTPVEVHTLICRSTLQTSYQGSLALVKTFKAYED